MRTPSEKREKRSWEKKVRIKVRKKWKESEKKEKNENTNLRKKMRTENEKKWEKKVGKEIEKRK